jgi:hypothetical protein
MFAPAYVLLRFPASTLVSEWRLVSTVSDAAMHNAATTSQLLALSGANRICWANAPTVWECALICSLGIVMGAPRKSISRTLVLALRSAFGAGA